LSLRRADMPKATGLRWRRPVRHAPGHARQPPPVTAVLIVVAGWPSAAWSDPNCVRWSTRAPATARDPGLAGTLGNRPSAQSRNPSQIFLRPSGDVRRGKRGPGDQKELFCDRLSATSGRPASARANQRSFSRLTPVSISVEYSDSELFEGNQPQNMLKRRTWVRALLHNFSNCRA
jgi:hypothetical protein